MHSKWLSNHLSSFAIRKGSLSVLFSATVAHLINTLVLRNKSLISGMLIQNSGVPVLNGIGVSGLGFPKTTEQTDVAVILYMHF
jgi:hypothetical protein